VKKKRHLLGAIICVPLLLTALSLLLQLVGCSDPERVVRIISSEDQRPVTNHVFSFYAYAPFDLEPLLKAGPVVRATLDTNGEAHVRLARRHAWARFDEGEKSFGTSLTRSDVLNGGEFRLYEAPPTPGDTNVYPSRYLLQIRKR